ncbi:MAG: hypothetical protein KGY43_04955 [Halodesulfurarchaeum sp.]|nr:hypothetical protein [Halodesulfurarchaeum sp.]
MKSGFRTAWVLVGLLVLSLVFSPVAVAQAESSSSGLAPAEHGPLLENRAATDSVRVQHTDAEKLSATDSKDQLVRQFIFERKPAEPGVIAAEMRFDIPDQIVELTSEIPDSASVTAADGFEPTGDGNYSWDGDTVDPSIRLSLSVNRTGAYHLKSAARGQVTETFGAKSQASETEPGLMFVDTGDWAIASVPPAGVYWSAYESDPTVSFASETAVAGSGVAGDRMVFLGTHTKATRSIDGQSVSVVVPEAATLESSTVDILGYFEAASPHLPNSPVRRSVVIAAPTTVDWGPYGLADRTDTWIRADQPIDEPGSVWLHEFVHLRQNFTTATDARWIREGMPEYYAALLTLEQGHIDFEAFSGHLDRGTQSRYEDVVLSRPDTWTSLANYAKGALVYGTLDRRIRLDSEQTVSARAVFESMNEHDQPIDQAYLDSAVSDLATDETRRDVEGYITTTQTPEMWSQTAHQAAFGAAPPDINASIGSLDITGPYRNDTVDIIPVLVPGETVSVPITITNEGEETGSYERILILNETVVATTSGSLDGGESTSVSLAHTIAEPGPKTLTTGATPWNFSVKEPATPVVTELTVSEAAVEVDSEVTIFTTVLNERSWPATGMVPITIDGTPLKEWDIRLTGGEAVERTASATFEKAGTYQISAGTETVTVTVTDPSKTTSGVPPDSQSPLTPTSSTMGSKTATETPGFTAGSFFIALAWLGAWFVRKNQ